MCGVAPLLSGRRGGAPQGDPGYDEERPRAQDLGSDISAAGPSVAEGTSGQRITREDFRRAARDGVVDREEELKGDGAFGSSTRRRRPKAPLL